MKLTKAIFIFIVTIFVGLVSFAQTLNNTFLQQLKQSKQYSIDNGLPSNHIYNVIKDKKGFLWIATDNGVSRFDGNEFINFGYKEGLPDCDVISVFLDKNDNVWMQSYSGKFVYFDNKKLCIVNDKKDSLLKLIPTSSDTRYYLLDDGCIAFECASKLFFYSNNNIPSIDSLNFNIKEVLFISGSINNLKIITFNGTIYEIINGKGSYYAKLNFKSKPILKEIPGKTIIVSFNDSSISMYKNFKQTIISTKLKSRIWSIEQFQNFIFLPSRNGVLYKLDKNLKTIDSLDIKENISNCFVDTIENIIWISTTDNGLYKLFEPSFKLISIPNNLLKQNVLIFKNNQSLFVCDNAGNVVENKENKLYNYILNKERKNYNNILVNNIFDLKGNTYVTAFGGLFKKVNYAFVKMQNSEGIKDIAIQNDSILLMAKFNCLLKYNLLSQTILDTIIKSRTTAVSFNSNGNILFGTTKGLFHYTNKSIENLGSYYDEFKDKRVSNIYLSADSLNWITNTSDTLYVLHNNKIVYKINLSKLYNSNIITCFSSKYSGCIWMGTDKAIIKLIYNFRNNVFSIRNQFALSTNMGKYVINSISLNKDSVYIATKNLVFSISQNKIESHIQTPIHLTRLTVNNISIEFNKNIQLKNGDYNIKIYFSAIDFTNFNHNFIYKIN